MSRAVAGIVLLMALAVPATAGHGRVRDTVGQPDIMPLIQQCVVTSMWVDGLPVMRHGWCSWDTERRRWEPMSRDTDPGSVIEIEPLED